MCVCTICSGVCVCFIAALRVIYNFGWKSYISDPVNMVDVVNNVCFVLTFMCRILGHYGRSEFFATMGMRIECDESLDEFGCSDHWLNLLTLFFFICLVLFVVIRISILSTVFRNMGYVVQTLYKTLNNVTNFFIMLALWIVGFAACQYMCTGMDSV